MPQRPRQPPVTPKARAARVPVTLIDVAREAGVSLATASRVVNGSMSRRPSPELIKRVSEAAERMGYSANASAQAIARGVTTVVGLIVSDIADPYFSSIAAGVTAAAEEHGLLVTLASTKGRPSRELDYVAALRRQRPLAIVLVGSRRADTATSERLAAELRSFRDGGGRVAAVSQPTLEVDTVAIRNAEAAADLAGALVAQGHRSFGVLSGPADLQTASDRVAGFRAGLRSAGVRLQERDLQHGGFNRDGGVQAAKELLTRRPDIGCLFAVNDVMAIGAMGAARELGYRIPEELAIAGFDDIPSAADTFPTLTTVRIDLEAVGRDAMRLVLEQDGTDGARVKYVTGTVILRASTNLV
jgi:LacI family transcriptional regulator